MNSKSTILVRVPKNIQKILEQKLPEYKNSTRWKLVWDTSGVKLDDWLGRPLGKRKKRK